MKQLEILTIYLIHIFPCLLFTHWSKPTPPSSLQIVLENMTDSAQSILFRLFLEIEDISIQRGQGGHISARRTCPPKGYHLATLTQHFVKILSTWNILRDLGGDLLFQRASSWSKCWDWASAACSGPSPCCKRKPSSQSILNKLNWANFSLTT